MIHKLTAMTAALALVGAVARASDQPYAGQQAREVANLSQSDIDALLAGQGWGLAKPAELNGYPGPAHVLELADDLDLSTEQTAQIEAIFADMQAQAKDLGAAYVDAEAHLSRMFRTGHANATMLNQVLADSGDLLARLRAVHLAAHLQTTPLLTEAQRERYAELRGYDGGDGAHTGHGGHNHD